MDSADIQCDIIFKQKYNEVGIPEFATFLIFKRFPKHMVTVVQSSESASRNRLTLKNLQTVPRLTLSQQKQPS